MNYASEMGSNAMMYRPSFMKIGSAIGAYTYTQTTCRPHEPTFVVFFFFSE
jgi:hypothetical protein